MYLNMNIRLYANPKKLINRNLKGFKKKVLTTLQLDYLSNININLIISLFINNQQLKIYWLTSINKNFEISFQILHVNIMIFLIIIRHMVLMSPSSQIIIFYKKDQIKSQKSVIFNLDQCQQLHTLMMQGISNLKIQFSGFTNSFHVVTRSSLAQQFNDKSVLQNYHAYLLFKTSKIEGSEIFSQFSPEEYRFARKLIIDLILATDNEYHHQHLHKLKEITSKHNISQWSQPQFKPFLLQIILHSADLNTATKPLQSYLEWTQRINQQLYKQGDQATKLGFEVDQIYIRKPNPKQCQISFLDHMIIPFYKSLYEISPRFDIEIKNIEQKKSYWKNLQFIQNLQ